AESFAMPAEPPTPERFEDPFARILETGWPEDGAELGSLLDRLCEEGWIEDLREAAGLPLGIVEDPRSPMPTLPPAAYQRVAQVLTVRALQIQARGNQVSALDHLLWALALSRHLRHWTAASYYEAVDVTERMALRGLERWLDRLGPQPDLLQRAL